MQFVYTCNFWFETVYIGMFKNVGTLRFVDRNVKLYSRSDIKIFQICTIREIVHSKNKNLLKKTYPHIIHDVDEYVFSSDL